MYVAFGYRPGPEPPDFLEIIDRTGKKKQFSGQWLRIMQVVWHPSSKEVWVKVAKEGSSTIYAVSLKGEMRLITSLDGYVALHDISRNGDLLIARNNGGRVETWGLAPGESRERNLSWLDGTHCFGTAENGNVLFFNEIRLGARGKSIIFMRKTDGSSPVRLGEGVGRSVSKDGKWVLAIDSIDSSGKLVLLPTGAGKIQSIDTSPINIIFSGAFFPDGKRILIYGVEPGHDERLYVMELNGGKPVALTPEGSFLGHVPDAALSPISPDGAFVAANDKDGAPRIFSVQNGAAEAVNGINENELILRWSEDGRSVYVANLFEETHPVKVKIYQVDRATGARLLKKEISPGDPAGIEGLLSVQLSEDAKSYYYCFQRSLSDLYLVSGIK
jgi:Tol biopolymer transport system component